MEDRRQLELAPEHEPQPTSPPPPPPPSSMLGELPLAALKPAVDPLSDRKLGAEAGVALAPDTFRDDVPKLKAEARRKPSRLCPHNRTKSKCKECGGSEICKHQRQRLRCKECGGSDVCQHNRRKSRCKDCGGSEICEHQRRKSRCKECGGSEICEHMRVKRLCKDCGGAGICEHKRQKSQCKDCGGTSICQHNKFRSQCKQCEGSSICQHQKQRLRCKECAKLRSNSSAVARILAPNAGVVDSQALAEAGVIGMLGHSPLLGPEHAPMHAAATAGANPQRAQPGRAGVGPLEPGGYGSKTREERSDLMNGGANGAAAFPPMPAEQPDQ